MAWSDLKDRPRTTGLLRLAGSANSGREVHWDIPATQKTSSIFLLQHARQESFLSRSSNFFTIHCCGADAELAPVDWYLTPQSFQEFLVIDNTDPILEVFFKMLPNHVRFASTTLKTFCQHLVQKLGIESFFFFLSPIFP
jgi:hypothetical protein